MIHFGLDRDGPLFEIVIGSDALKLPGSVVGAALLHVAVSARAWF
jgi:hypothetical protein